MATKITMVKRELNRYERRHHKQKGRHISIIGGGLAGLYAALRYLQKGYKVSLYEAQIRLGGRIYSIFVPGVGTALEVGGMRYTTANKLLVNIIEELGLETVPFDMPIGYHLEHVSVPAGRDVGDFDLPYKLRPEVEKLPMQPGVLIGYAMVMFLKELTLEKVGRKDQQVEKELLRKIASLEEGKPDWSRFSATDWKLITRYGRRDGTPVYCFGFRNILSHYLGKDGEDFVVQALGYDTVPSNWNAAAALPWFAEDFSQDTEYRMIVGGFGELVTRLVQRIEQAGGKIHKGWRLTRLTPVEPEIGTTPRWKMRFAVGEHGDMRHAWADRVILALPPGPIEDLHVTHRDWDFFKRDLLSSVQKRNLLKVFLIYEEAWWDGMLLPGTLTARLYTDYHLRGIFYYGQDWIREHSDYDRACNPHRAMVMVYTDGENVDFFAPAMRNLSPASQMHFKYPSDWEDINPVDRQKITQLLQERGASKRMVQKIHEELEDIHGLARGRIPSPLFAIYADWAGDRFEGSGWHTWKPGVQPWEIAKRMLDPFMDGSLSVIGEAFSSVQGWVEGALRTAEFDVAHHTGLGDPGSLDMSAEELYEYISP